MESNNNRDICLLAVPVTLVLCFLVQANSFAANNNPTDSEVMLDVVTEGYLANRESIQSLYCEFTLLLWIGAKNQRSPGSNEKVTRIDGIWAEDKGNSVCKFGVNINFSEHLETIGPSRKGESPVGMSPYTVLQSNEGYRLSSTLIPNSASIGADNSTAVRGVRLTPWDFGSMGDDESGNPASTINLRNDIKTIQCEYLGVSNHNGSDVIQVLVWDSERKDIAKVTYSFDPAKSFLLMGYTASIDPLANVIETHVLEAKEVKDGIWFPMLVHKRFPTNKNNNYNHKSWDVTKLTVNESIPEDVFKINLENGKQIHDNINPTSAYTLSNDMLIGTEDLKDLYAKSQNRIKMKLKSFEFQTKRIRRRKLWGISLLVISMIGLFYYGWKRYSRA